MTEDIQKGIIAAWRRVTSCSARMRSGVLSLSRKCALPTAWISENAPTRHFCLQGT
jgi:hypothetical protein